MAIDNSSAQASVEGERDAVPSITRSLHGEAGYLKRQETFYQTWLNKIAGRSAVLFEFTLEKLPGGRHQMVGWHAGANAVSGTGIDHHVEHFSRILQCFSHL